MSSKQTSNRLYTFGKSTFDCFIVGVRSVTTNCGNSFATLTVHNIDFLTDASVKIVVFLVKHLGITIFRPTGDSELNKLNAQYSLASSANNFHFTLKRATIMNVGAYNTQKE